MAVNLHQLDPGCSVHAIIMTCEGERVISCPPNGSATLISCSRQIRVKPNGVPRAKLHLPVTLSKHDGPHASALMPPHSDREVVLTGKRLSRGIE